MDVDLVRVLTVVLTFFTGVPVVAYIVALFVMPEEQPTPYAGPPTGHVPTGATGPADPVWGSRWSAVGSGPVGRHSAPASRSVTQSATQPRARTGDGFARERFRGWLGRRSGAGRGDADPGGAVRRGKQLGIGAGRPAGCRFGAER